MQPLKQFLLWYHEAEKKNEMRPEAMALATLSPSQKVTARFVLFKGLHQGGLCFFTNYQSRKMKELKKNNWGCLLFYWPKLEKQIRLEGHIYKTAAKVSDAYWKTRPRESQLSAWASPQSQTIPHYSFLIKKLKNLKKEFKDKVIPRPSFWGGLYLKPEMIEFWSSRPGRLHLRELFIKKGSRWKCKILAP